MKRIANLLGAIVTLTLAGIPAAGCIAGNVSEPDDDGVAATPIEDDLEAEQATAEPEAIDDEPDALAGASGECQVAQDSVVSGGVPLASDQYAGLDDELVLLRAIAGPKEAADAVDQSSAAPPSWCSVNSPCSWCEAQFGRCSWPFGKVKYAGSIIWQNDQCYCSGSRSGCC